MLFDLHADFFADFVYPLYATIPTAAKIAIMATTTNNSISENPFFSYDYSSTVIRDSGGKSNVNYSRGEIIYS